VSPGAHPSSYNSVATTLYSTLVERNKFVALSKKKKKRKKEMKRKQYCLTKKSSVCFEERVFSQINLQITEFYDESALVPSQQ
jgi:hypothetical protein